MEGPWAGEEASGPLPDAGLPGSPQMMRELLYSGRFLLWAQLCSQEARYQRQLPLTCWSWQAQLNVFHPGEQCSQEPTFSSG